MAHQNIYTESQRKNLLIISISALLIFILYGLRSYISALIGGVLLYVLFIPMFRFLFKARTYPLRVLL
jgi:uncharacterized membrane protein YkgB